MAATSTPKYRRDKSRPVDRVVGQHCTTDSYRRAIERACRKAGVSVWTPHRLRHNAATFIRRESGIEAAQIMLGHARADVTQIYAEVNQEKAITIAQKIYYTAEFDEVQSAKSPYDALLDQAGSGAGQPSG